MTDALILWALGRSKKLAGLATIYAVFLAAKTGMPTPVNIRGVRLDGDVYDLTGGTLLKRDT